MNEIVNGLVKVKGADSQAVNAFISERFADIFSKAKKKQKDTFQVLYSGGSIIRPWGFKATSTVQSADAEALIIKLWGRPKFQFMGYIAMLLMIGSFLCLIVNPIEYWFCAVLILLFYVALASERKASARKINQVLKEVKERFS